MYLMLLIVCDDGMKGRLSVHPMRAVLQTGLAA